MLQTGATLDRRYRVQYQIDKGGTAIIYLARDLHTNKDVVLKVLRRDAFSRPQVGIERLEHEAYVLAKLDHPNIVKYVEFRPSTAETYLVMEFVRGEHLGKRMRRRSKPFSVREITHWIGALCDALKYLNDHDIVHRDLKPGNILITPDNKLVLIDFNVAMDLTRAARDPHAREPVGTAVYAAPEQMDKRAVDARADVYTLGAIIYELLSFTRPFSGVGRNASSKDERWKKLKQAKTSRDAPSLAKLRPDLPNDIIAVVDKALAYQSERRWAHAGILWNAWLRALGAPVDEIEEPESPESPEEEDEVGQGGSKRLRLALAVVAMVVIVSVGLGAAILGLGGNNNSSAQTYFIHVCDRADIGSGATWITCVDSITLPDADELVVNVKWQIQAPNKNVWEKDSDVGNRNMYLLDGAGKRYDHLSVSGAATKKVDLETGQIIRGAFEFERPEDLSGSFTFVDDDMGLEIQFRVQ